MRFAFYFCALLFPALARASLITSAASLVQPVALVNFSQFPGPFAFGPGPVQVGSLAGLDISWSSTNSVNQGGAVIGSSAYNLGTNGSWTSDRFGYVALNAGVGSMTLMFADGPVSQVGAYLNYAPNAGPGVVIAALDQNGNPLESHDLSVVAPIVTPGGLNAGAFRGIQQAELDIFGFRVSNSGVALDDLQLSTQVPEPGSFTLAAIGCIAGGVVVWRSRRSQCNRCA